MTAFNTMLDVAVAYAQAGARVLPLHTPTGQAHCSCRATGCDDQGKHPRTLRGLTDATSDLGEVARWWRMWPDANIGLRPHSGQVVVDVDPRHQGDVQLAAMQDRFGKLPATRTCRTGSGGLHLWFTCPGDDLIGKLAEGLDIKSHTGYLVAPPSLHMSGGTYAWINTGPIVEAPPYLRALLVRPPVLSRPTSTSVTPAVVAGLVRVVAAAEDGNRNRALFWACLRAAEKDIDTAPLIDAAVTVGLDRRAAEATARSAARTILGEVS